MYTLTSHTHLGGKATTPHSVRLITCIYSKLQDLEIPVAHDLSWIPRIEITAENRQKKLSSCVVLAASFRRDYQSRCFQSMKDATAWVQPEDCIPILAINLPKIRNRPASRSLKITRLDCYSPNTLMSLVTTVWFTKKLLNIIIHMLKIVYCRTSNVATLSMNNLSCKLQLYHLYAWADRTQPNSAANQ